jgi:predicted TIM-barrel fold metal-dependent hydrolase
MESSFLAELKSLTHDNRTRGTGGLEFNRRPHSTSDYTTSTAVAKAFVAAAPERLVWGSDWPHPSADLKSKPDDAEWASDAGIRHRILVENPEALYGFPHTS